jgi:hypothetical protein
VARSPFFTPRWLALHALTATLVVGFLALAWWQVRRAAAGNVLSYAYAVEWPVFAAFVVALWVREVRMRLRPPAPDQPPSSPEPVVKPLAPGHIPFSAAIQRRAWPSVAADPERTADSADPADAEHPADPADAELAAYNDYLAWLAADPDRRPDDYPKGSP